MVNYKSISINKNTERYNCFEASDWGAADESVKNEGASSPADVASGSDSDHRDGSSGIDAPPRPSTAPQGLQTPLAGRPAFIAERLAGFFSAEVGLKPPDVPKAMALAHAEHVEDPTSSSNWC